MRGHVGQRPNPAIKPSVQAIVQPKAGHLKGTWKIMLPMVALITLSGCTGNNQATNEKKGVKEMGNQELVIKQPNTTQADTLKLTPVKTEGKEKRDSLMRARIRELKDEMKKYDLPLPERGFQRASPETMAMIAREFRFITLEGGMYSSALKGDLKDVEKGKTELIEFGEQVGDRKRAEDIIKNFDRINKMK